jgi:hypothetical protein
MRTSGDTVLRELRRAGGPAPPTPPVVVGIDDWAIKRGHRYGHGDRRPADVSPDRRAWKPGGNDRHELAATTPEH